MAAQHDDEDGHDHGQTVTSDNERRIRFVFIFTAGYAVVQAIGGWLSGLLLSLPTLATWFPMRRLSSWP